VSRLIALAALLIAGCGPIPVKMYEGPERAAGEQAVLSALGLYPQTKTSILVTKINGAQPPSIGRAAEYLLLPGRYLISWELKHDQRTNIMGGVTWKGAAGDFELNAVAGHTYIPNAQIFGNQAIVVFEDKGLNYPRDCLPLYTQAMFYGKPRPGCP
jgi:hypothetical protein